MKKIGIILMGLAVFMGISFGPKNIEVKATSEKVQMEVAEENTEENVVVKIEPRLLRTNAIINYFNAQNQRKINAKIPIKIAKEEPKVEVAAKKEETNVVKETKMANEPKVEESRETPKKSSTSYSKQDVDIIARTIYGEAGGIPSKAEQAAVAWCILNRVDSYNSSVKKVVTPSQFHGYIYWGDCPQNFYDLAEDVLSRWEREKNGESNVGRTLPSDYLFFCGDGKHNNYRKEYDSSGRWDWSLPSPYGD